VEGMNESITSEVEARLEALFGDMDEQSPVQEELAQPQGSPLQKLKAAVLSLEWEITDDVISTFMSELDGLKQTYERDQVAQIFLQLLIALGSYVRAKRGKAHPHTLAALNEIFGNFEKALASKPSAPAKKKLLRQSVEKFKLLKQEISLKRTVAVKKVEDKNDPVIQELSPASLHGSEWGISKESWENLMKSNKDLAQSVETLVHNMEEVTELFRSQYDAIREEIRATAAVPERRRTRRVSGRAPKYSASRATKRSRRA
jgi:hypothetical protein